jgi:hypothetical protein
MKKVKSIIQLMCVFISMILVQSCYNDFDEMKAKELVYLSEEDIKLYSEFDKMIKEDFHHIQKLHTGYGNKNYVSTNSYYLFQIDSLKYATIIDKVKIRNIYSNAISTTSHGMVVFRLKDMSNIKWDDYNDTHIHELIFDFDSSEYSYSNINVVVDSLIGTNIKYLYFTAKTGH